MLWIIAAMILMMGAGIKLWGVQELVAAATSATAIEGMESVSAPAASEKDPRAYRPQNWCFMGENAVGRFCIELKNPDQCNKKNHFMSRDACEMTPASAMPLGISNMSGMIHSPFMEPQRQLATTY